MLLALHICMTDVTEEAPLPPCVARLRIANTGQCWGHPCIHVVGCIKPCQGHDMLHVGLLLTEGLFEVQVGFVFHVGVHLYACSAGPARRGQLVVSLMLDL